MVNKLTLIGLGLSGSYVASQTGALDGDPTFTQPAATALSRLAAERRLVEGTGMGSLSLAGRDAVGNTIVIAVTRAGNPRALICRVTITAVSDLQSRAETDCTQHTAVDATSRALGKKALEIVVREHVTATVEGRRYDIEKVGNRMLAFAAFAAPALMASGAVR